MTSASGVILLLLLGGRADICQGRHCGRTEDTSHETPLAVRRVVDVLLLVAVTTLMVVVMGDGCGRRMVGLCD